MYINHPFNKLFTKLILLIIFKAYNYPNSNNEAMKYTIKINNHMRTQF